MDINSKQSLHEQIEELEENDILDKIIQAKFRNKKNKTQAVWQTRQVKTYGGQKNEYQYTQFDKRDGKKSLGVNAFRNREKNSENNDINNNNNVVEAELSKSLIESHTLRKKRKSEVNDGDKKNGGSDLENKYYSEIGGGQKQNSQLARESHKKSTYQSVLMIKEKYFEYGYRWINSLAYFFACVLQAFSMHTFTPIGPLISDAYDKTPSEVTLPTLMFMLVTPLTMFFVNYISDFFGIKIGTSIGASLLIIGTGLKCLVNQEFYMVMVGAMFCGVGNSFILNCPTKVASNWFKPANRGLISTFFTLGIMTSSTFGILMPPIFVKDEDTVEQQRQGVFNMMLFEFIVTAVFMVFLIAVFKAEPPSPPGYSAKLKREPFLPQIKMLFTNLNYYCLIGAMGILLGTIAAFTSVISYYTVPYNITSDQCSQLVILTTIGGIVSSPIFGIYIKKTKKLKQTAIICLVLTNIFFMLMQLNFYLEGPFFVNIIIFLFIGASFLPAIPAMVELGAEIAYPVAEPSAAGFLFAAQQLIGFIMGQIVSQFINSTPQTSFIGYIIFQCLFVGALVCMIIVKEDFRRTRGEIKGSVCLNKKLQDLDESEIEEIKEQLEDEGII